MKTPENINNHQTIQIQMYPAVPDAAKVNTWHYFQNKVREV